MTDVIAQRLFRKGKGSAVVARIHAPERMPDSSEWSCKVDVQGLEARYEQVAVGVDSFQALCLGLRLLCAHLDKFAASLRFLDGREGDTGTPLIVPWSFSPSLKAEAYRLIDGKIKDELGAEQ